MGYRVYVGSVLRERFPKSSYGFTHPPAVWESQLLYCFANSWPGLFLKVLAILDV